MHCEADVEPRPKRRVTHHLLDHARRDEALLLEREGCPLMFVGPSEDGRRYLGSEIAVSEHVLTIAAAHPTHDARN
jgi:hypothetical protein